MRTFRVMIFLLLPTIAFGQAVTGLSVERQQEMIDLYMWATGQSQQKPLALSSMEHEHGDALKCGLPIVSDFIHNYKNIDPALLKSSGVQLSQRRIRSHTLVSPSGRFLIHYDRTDMHAVYRADVDIDHNGVPDYVDSVAMIFDSTYEYTVTTLGYPEPIDDSFYPEGGDDKYDVFISELGDSFYGLAWPDSIFVDDQGVVVATSWIELDNDYQGDGFVRYHNRPLDAVRVTAAHEFFHAVHFALDYYETEVRVSDDLVQRYWMEMSAVWMEEEQYDHINDYYAYLPEFFSDPSLSIQTFQRPTDLRPYASAIFPIYLSEKFGREAIHNVWGRCRSLGSGPSFLTALKMFADSVDATTSEVISYPGIFAEFTVWNFFTGFRSAYAPNDIGYPEKWVYPAYPQSELALVDEYPAFVTGNQNAHVPEHNGEAFLVWDQTQAIDYTVDETFDFFLGMGNGVTPTMPNPWGMAILYQLEQDCDSFEVEYLFLPDDQVAALGIPDPRLYRSVTFALSPASPDLSITQNAIKQFFSYITDETLVDSLIDPTSCGVFVPPAFIAAPSMILAPYPNPAVFSEMEDPFIRFRVEVAFDSANFIFYQTDPLYIVADLFNIAGERVRDIPYYASSAEEVTVFELEWDGANQSGEPVASGVYVAYIRIFSKQRNGVLLAEGETKVLLVR